MPLGIDELLESALGPWGLVLGVGLGAVVASRRKLIPAVARTAGKGVAQFESVTSVVSKTARSGLQPLAPVGASIAGGGAAAAGFASRARSMDVKHSGEALLLGVSRAWSDLYSEARAEFEARHPSANGHDSISGERSDDINAHVDTIRDEHGRFVKRNSGETSVENGMGHNEP